MNDTPVTIASGYTAVVPKQFLKPGQPLPELTANSPTSNILVTVKLPSGEVKRLPLSTLKGIQRNAPKPSEIAPMFKQTAVPLTPPIPSVPSTSSAASDVAVQEPLDKENEKPTVSRKGKRPVTSKTKSAKKPTSKVIKSPEDSGPKEPKCGVWSDVSTIDLIHQYQLHECLYNITHPQYHNKGSRMKALQQIHQQILKSRPMTKEEEIKIKWNYLKNSYGKERKKIQLSESSGMDEDGVYTPTMAFYDDLEFLEPYTRTRDSISSLDSMDENNNDDYDYDCDDLDLDEVIAGNAPKDKSFEEGRKAGPDVKKRKNSVAEKEVEFFKEAGETLRVMREGKQSSSQAVNQPISDHWNTVGQYVASSLRTMSPDAAKKCELDVMRMVIVNKEKDMSPGIAET